jgi:hypothetical protein
MKKILVSLISDQTIPNVQFIKEMIADEYLFVTTETMEKKGVLNWILNATNLDIEKIQLITVSPFLYDAVYEVVEKNIKKDAKYLVNLTGGTKIMSLAVNDVFKLANSEFYYVTGNKNYLKITPGIKQPLLKLEKDITLSEYLISYGFEVKKSIEPEFSYETSSKIFHYFLNSFDKEVDLNILHRLRENYRGKNLANISEIEGLKDFIKRLGFYPSEKNNLNKKETKYLTGDWFEEYFYHQLKQLKSIQKDGIGTGWIIVKNGIPNEFDILFIHEDQLNIIECKTFVWKDPEETQTIISETIYKADSLKNKLGLFAKTSIVTLSDLTSTRLKVHLQRAQENKIAVYGKNELLQLDKTLKKLF